MQQGAAARYALESAGSGPDIVYRLKELQNGETVWQLTEPWPFRIQANVCRDEAMGHFAAVSRALASWDGTPGEVIDHSVVAVAFAAFRNRALRPSDPDSPLGELQAKLEKRYASGGAPPVDIIDPNFQLANCDGQDAALDPTPSYIAIGVDFPSIACENTVAGQKLLLRRRWECSPEPTRNCVCGSRTNGNFFYVFDLPEHQSDSVFSEFRFGRLWKRYAVDPDKLTITEAEQDEELSLSPCSFDE